MKLVSKSQSGNDSSNKPVETLDLTKDYGNGTSRMTTKNPSNQLFSAHNVPKKLSITPSTTATMSPVSSNIASPQFDFRYCSCVFTIWSFFFVGFSLFLFDIIVIIVEVVETIYEDYFVRLL